MAETISLATILIIGLATWGIAKHIQVLAFRQRILVAEKAVVDGQGDVERLQGRNLRLSQAVSLLEDQVASTRKKLKSTKRKNTELTRQLRASKEEAHAFEREAIAFERAGFRLTATMLGLHSLEKHHRLKLDITRIRIEQIVSEFRESLDRQRRKSWARFILRTFASLLPIVGERLVDVVEIVVDSDLSPLEVTGEVDVPEGADLGVLAEGNVRVGRIFLERGFRDPSKYKTPRGCVPPIRDINKARKWAKDSWRLLSRLKRIEKDKKRLDLILAAASQA